MRVGFRLDALFWITPDVLGAEYPSCRAWRLLIHLCKMMYKNVKLLKDTKSTVTMPSYTDSSKLMSSIVDSPLAAAP